MLFNIEGGKRFTLPGEKPVKRIKTSDEGSRNTKSTDAKNGTLNKKSSVKGFKDTKDRHAWLTADTHQTSESSSVTPMDLFRKLDQSKLEAELKRARKDKKQGPATSGPNGTTTRSRGDSGDGSDQENTSKKRNADDAGLDSTHDALRKPGVDEQNSEAGSPPQPKRMRTKEPADGEEQPQYEDNKMLNAIRRVFRLKLPSFISTETQDISAEKSFNDLGIHQLLQPFPMPTKIQARVIPHLLSEESYPILMQSETGSGKTLAFVLPLVQKLLFTTQIVPGNTTDFRGLGTLAVIIAPTRELAKQIHDVVESVVKIRKWGSTDTPHSKRHWLTSGLLSGTCLSASDRPEGPNWNKDGQPNEAQGHDERNEHHHEDGKNSMFTRTKEKRQLRKGIHILVCTPGRLVDHLRTTSSFKTGNLAQIVIDEADHTIDLGMSHLLKEAVQLLRARCAEALKPSPRVVLTSATIVSNVRYLVKAMIPASMQDRLLFIDSDSERTVMRNQPLAEMKLPKQLVQYRVDVRLKLRLVAFLRMLNAVTTKCMVFALGCDMVEFLHALLLELQEQGFLKHVGVKRLHGRMTVAQREKEFQEFKATGHKQTVLLCTDVAARGLDLPDGVGVIAHVDPPQTMEDYIHRIGRTARCGRPGTSLLFAPIPTFLADSSQLKPFCFEDEDRSLFARKGVETIIDASPDLKALAVKAFQTWVQSVSRIPGLMKEMHLGHAAGSFGISEKPKDVLDPEICGRILAGTTDGDGFGQRRWHEGTRWKSKGR